MFFTTADPKIEDQKIINYKEAINDFNNRNPMAGGGMLVQPSAIQNTLNMGKKKERSKKTTCRKKKKFKYNTRTKIYYKIWRTG